MAGLGAEVSWVATAFRVCARRLCLAVVPVCGARSAGSGGSAPSDERAARGLRGLRGLVVVPMGGGGAWPGFEIDHSERSSCVAISRAGRRPQAQPAGSSGQVAGGWRAVRGLRGLVVVPVGGGGSWRWAACSDERAARGLRGLAGLRDDAPSEARGADGERAGRPRAARKRGGGGVARKRAGEDAARKCGGEGAARKRGGQELSVRRRRSRRGRLRNRSRMGRCGPSGSRGRSRRLRRLRRCRGRGRGRRRRRPGRV